MLLEPWAKYWTDAIVGVIRSGAADSYAGPVRVRVVPFGFNSARNAGRMQLEGGVLALHDVQQDRVALAALPIWDRSALQVPPPGDDVALQAVLADDAARHGMGALAVPDGYGSQRTAYLRVIDAPAAALLAPDAAEVADGDHLFTSAGLWEVERFLEDILSANERVLPRVMPTPPQSVMPAPATVSSTDAASAETAVFPTQPYGSAPDQQAAPASAMGTGFPEGQPAAQADRPRRSRAPLWVGIGVLAVLAIIGALVAVGFLNGYSHEVVVREAQNEITAEEATGNYDVELLDNQICGDGEDYLSCLNQHITVDNSVCANRNLTAEADSICDELDGFIGDASVEYDSCGADCLTSVGENGLWGFPYLEVVPEMQTVVVQEARPEVSETRRCDFVLGPVQFGSCPR